MTAIATARQRQHRAPLMVGLVGLALTSTIAVRALAATDWDTTLFIAFGEKDAATREYGEDRLGKVYFRGELGHDGKYFFVQANDPWILDPSENAGVLDLPRYRSQRMLYPLLAGGFGLLGPEVIAWTMLIVNLIAFGVGSWAVANLSMRMGGSPWLGLAFTLNIGLIGDLYIDGSGVVAAAAAFWALLLLVDKHSTWAIAVLSASVLAREVMVIVCAGAALWLWREGSRRLALLTAVIPVSVAAIWGVYLRFRLPGDEPSAGAFDLPFVGLVEAIPGWANDPLSAASGIAVALLLGVCVVRAIAKPSLVMWALIGFAPLAMLFTEKVWGDWFDSTRAVAPLMTAFVLAAFADRSPDDIRLEYR